MDSDGKGVAGSLPIVAIKGAGEMASAVAWRLFQARFRRIYMMELPQPLAVRRGVAFSEALYDGEKVVEGVTAVKTHAVPEIHQAWEAGRIPVLADPDWQTLGALPPGAVVDAILAKRNLGTRLGEAPLVIALGPGFQAGRDAHLVIETNRGHHLGRIIAAGSAEPDTGVPAPVGGYGAERVVRAPGAGEFRPIRKIGERVEAAETLGHVAGRPVLAGLSGIVRGLIHAGTRVEAGQKLGDIEVRPDIGYCDTISDKARAISGSVLESLLRNLPLEPPAHAEPPR